MPNKPRSASVAVLTTDKDRLGAKVNGLDCTSNIGWSRIMAYATPEECVRTYAKLSFAFGPAAWTKLNVFFLRKNMVMAYLTPAERLGVFSLVSSEAKVGASALKRTAIFTNKQLVLADGSISLDRLEAASTRFPALEDVSVDLSGALSDSNGWTDAGRAPILLKLCTFTFVTKLVLDNNDIAVVPDAIRDLTNLKYLSLFGNKIAVVPDAIGDLTNLKYLSLTHNKIVTLPGSIDGLTALERLHLDRNELTAVPDWIGSLTALRTLLLNTNHIATLPTTIGGMTVLTILMLSDNELAGLPDAIGKLKDLEMLILYNNQLTALPESIVALTKLTYLNLTNLRSKTPLNRAEQFPAVQTWLQAQEDNPMCDFKM